MANELYYGDNLDVLRRHVATDSVDLVYLDPPFNSNADYNLLFAEEDGTRAAAQIEAFGDTWRWDQAAAAAFQETVEQGGDVAKAMIAFQTLLGDSNMLAYLAMMAPRLVELRRVLKPTGSLFLHCDPTASHYLKILLDGIFGADNFVNEIVWSYRKWSTGKYSFQRNHDTIFFYSRTGTKDRTFNQLFMERAESTKTRFGDAKIVSGHDSEGNRVPSRTEDVASDGVRMDDVWEIGRVAPIKQLFPTQKPSALLERIITATTNEGDVVLDPFCGCGTTVVAAQRLKRKWVGIDITYLSVALMKSRLGKPDETGYEVIGEPTSAEDAKQLAGEDPYQFQWWALGLIGARPTDEKKGADKGIDGRLYFFDDGATAKQLIVSVKAGKVGAAQLRDLVGVVEREGAQIGAFISLNDATSPMRKEAASAGQYKSPLTGTLHPKIQLLTVGELLEGKRLDLPAIAPQQTMTSAPVKAPTKAKPDQMTLGTEAVPADAELPGVPEVEPESDPA